MKNVFKFLGIALLASSLVFASCGKDEETETPGTENNGGNNNGGGNGNGGGNTAGSIRVVKGTVNFTCPQDSLYAKNQNSTIYFYASPRKISAQETPQGTNLSYIDKLLQAYVPAVVGSYDTASAAMYLLEGNFYNLGRTDTNYRRYQQYPDWQLDGTCAANVSSFNATGMTFSATITGSMVNVYQAFNNYINDTGTDPLSTFLANATRENMTVTATNVKFVAPSKGNNNITIKLAK